MKVSHLELRHFRNYESLELQPGVEVNLFLGQNAQGKTNLIEAISLLMRGRSNRIRTRTDILQRGQRECRMKGKFQTDRDVRHDVELNLRGRGSRKVMVDGQKLERTSALYEMLPCILLESSDLDMLSGPPGSRRTFLDTVCLELSSHHVRLYSDHQKLLRSRNLLLQRGRLGRELDVVTRQLSECAARLVLSRLAAVDALRDALEQLGKEQPGETLELRYKILGWPQEAGAHPREPVKLAAWLAEEMIRKIEEDRQGGATSLGPHRDDLSLKVGGNPIRRVASRGQLKDLLYRLKLAEAAAVESRREERPVLLLDDAFSETDRERRERMLSCLPVGSQVFLTGTDGTMAEDLKGRDCRRYRVSSGVVAAED